MIPRFTYVPDYGLNETTQPSLNVSKFGDGYEQVSADGLNHMLRKWDVSFSNRDQNEIEAIKDFLRARGGVEAFEFPVPNSPTGEIALVRCGDWSRSFARWRSQDCKFTFREVVA